MGNFEKFRSAKLTNSNDQRIVGGYCYEGNEQSCNLVDCRFEEQLGYCFTPCGDVYWSDCD